MYYNGSLLYVVKIIYDRVADPFYVFFFSLQKFQSKNILFYRFLYIYPGLMQTGKSTQVFIYLLFCQSRDFFILYTKCYMKVNIIHKVCLMMISKYIATCFYVHCTYEVIFSMYILGICMEPRTKHFQTRLCLLDCSRYTHRHKNVASTSIIIHLVSSVILYATHEGRTCVCKST